jgi:hypothetical protein
VIRLLVLGVLVCLALGLGAVRASSADASYTPSLAPYNLSGNNSNLTTKLQAVNYYPGTSVPGAPTLPSTNGATYPASWADGADVAAKAEQAGRFLPLLSALGNVVAGAGALTLGLQIGGALNSYFDISGSIGDTTSSPLQVTGIRWHWDTTSTKYCSGGGPCLAGPRWYFQANRTNVGTFSEIFDNAPCNSGNYCGLSWEQTTTSAGTEQSVPYGTYCGFNATACEVRTATEDQLRGAVKMKPITSSQYSSHTNTTSTTYTPPTTTTADLTASRAAIGAPVAGSSGGHYVDAAGNPLTIGQVVIQLDLNCRLDSSYCAGGSNDPTGDGALLSSTKIAPDCTGLLYSACVTAFANAGFTATPVRTTLDIGHADLTKPADAVVQTTPAPNTHVDAASTVTITANPNPLPVVIPSPLPHETYSVYLARLSALGVSGTVTEHDVSDANIDPTRGPGEVTTTTPAPGTRALPSDPVSVYANPGGTAAAGSSGSAPSGPTLPGISIPSLSTPCSVFPFGIPCWIVSQLGALNASAVAPSFSIGLPSIAGGSNLNVNLDHPFGADLSAIMAVVRVVLLFVSFLGLVLWLGGMAMGGSTGGGGSSGSEE